MLIWLTCNSTCCTSGHLPLSPRSDRAREEERGRGGGGGWTAGRARCCGPRGRASSRAASRTARRATRRPWRCQQHPRGAATARRWMRTGSWRSSFPPRPPQRWVTFRFLLCGNCSLTYGLWPNSLENTSDLIFICLLAKTCKRGTERNTENSPREMFL